MHDLADRLAPVGIPIVVDASLQNLSRLSSSTRAKKRAGRLEDLVGPAKLLALAFQGLDAFTLTGGKTLVALVALSTSSSLTHSSKVCCLQQILSAMDSTEAHSVKGICFDAAAPAVPLAPRPRRKTCSSCSWLFHDSILLTLRASSITGTIQAVDQFVRAGHFYAFLLKCSSFLPIDHLHKSSPPKLINLTQTNPQLNAVVQAPTVYLRFACKY